MSPSADVSEVGFLVDGTQLWVEQKSPYVYGEDGNYLVTSFLKPGTHVFTVRAIGVDGRTAEDSVSASVPVAPSPPTDLAGTWKAFISGVPGWASLVITSTGWYMGRFPITHTDGNMVDVAYLAPGLVEVRTGMATGHDINAGSTTDDDLNGWCDDKPGSPVRYHWAVSGNHLRMTFAGGTPCEGFTKFMTSSWIRVS